MTNLQFNMKGDPSDSERALRCWSTIRGNNYITHRREELMKQPWREKYLWGRHNSERTERKYRITYNLQYSSFRGHCVDR